MNIGPYITESLDANADSEKIYEYLLETNFSKIAKVKLPSKSKYLGHGSKGTAFDIGNNKVLKITDDKSEADASAAITGKKLDGLGYIYGVYHSKEKIVTNVYFLILEKLKFRTNTKKTQNHIFELFDAIEIRQIAGFQVVDSITYTDKILKMYDEYGISKEALNLAKGMNSLYKNGISFKDLHWGNVLWKGNLPVIIDLGYSEGGRGPIKNFENKQDTTITEI